MKTGGFAGFKNQIFSKWFIKEDGYGYGKKPQKLGGATQTKNDLDKDVLEVKVLVTKIGHLSKLTFKQNFFLYMMKATWFFTRFTQRLIKNYKYVV